MCFGSSDGESHPPARPKGQAKEGRQQGHSERQPLTISGPMAAPGQVTASGRDYRGMRLHYDQYEMARNHLQTALSNVADYLKCRKESFTLVAVGGAVNTILLRSRETTHYVDFFCQLLKEPRLGMLRDAGVHAAQMSSLPMSLDWLNNATARIPGVAEHIDNLVKEAASQNAVVFQKPGLKVLAAPWNYSFIKKVSSISRGTGRDYDGDDAVAYLHQHINRHSGRPVPFRVVQEWGARYRSLCPAEIVQQVNELYHRTHGTYGITFEASGTKNISKTSFYAIKVVPLLEDCEAHGPLTCIKRCYRNAITRNVES